MPRPRNTKRRKLLIEEHSGRVTAAVKVFIRSHPEFSHLEEDLHSAGMIRLIDTVDRFLAGKVTHLLTYLRLSIYSGLWETARSENVIQSPRHCPARRRPGQSDYKDESRSIRQDEIEQAIGAACLDDSDRLIVSLLRSGRTLRGIATELMISIEEVRTRGQAIEDRVRADLC